MFANRICIVALLSLLVGWGSSAQAKEVTAASAVAAAAPPVVNVAPALPSPEASAAADELTRLQDQTMVLQAQLKELEARQAVEARLEALKGTATPTLANVRIVAVEGMGANKIATVRLADGSEFEVAPGDRVVDGIRVTGIEHGAVVVRLRSGKLARLRVGAGDVGLETVSDGVKDSGSGIGSGASLAPRLQGKPE